MTAAIQREDPVNGQAYPSLDASTIALSGEIDARSATEYASLIFSDPAWATTRTVDCSKVTFFSAAGLGLLLRIANQRPISVVASPSVARLIEICDVADTLVIAN